MSRGFTHAVLLALAWATLNGLSYSDEPCSDASERVEAVFRQFLSKEVIYVEGKEYQVIKFPDEWTLSDLRRCGDLGVHPIAAHLSSQDAEERELAVHLLANQGSRRGIPLLGKALGDDVPRVRFAAVIAARALGTDGIRPQLESISLRDPDLKVREAARSLLKVRKD